MVLLSNVMQMAMVLGRRAPRSGQKVLSSKRGPRNFYKGKGCMSTGRFTRKGGFKYVEEKLPKYIVPDLTNCAFNPYVAHNTPKVAAAAAAATPEQ